MACDTLMVRLDDYTRWRGRCAALLTGLGIRGRGLRSQLRQAVGEQLRQGWLAALEGHQEGGRGMKVPVARGCMAKWRLTCGDIRPLAPITSPLVCTHQLR